MNTDETTSALAQLTQSASDYHSTANAAKRAFLAEVTRLFAPALQEILSSLDAEEQRDDAGWFTIWTQSSNGIEIDATATECSNDRDDLLGDVNGLLSYLSADSVYAALLALEMQRQVQFLRRSASVPPRFSSSYFRVSWARIESGFSLCVAQGVYGPDNVFQPYYPHETAS